MVSTLAAQAALSTLYDAEEGSREKDYAFHVLEQYIAQRARLAGDVERWTEVLVAHQRQGSHSCLCGDLPLGTSFARHQAEQIAALAPSAPQAVETAEEVGLDLSTSGLLWLINATTFHPRGFALAMDGRGRFLLLGDGTEAWVFVEEDAVECHRAAEATFAAHRPAAADGGE